MRLVTLFELERHWNDLQETSLIRRNNPGKEMNVKNPTAVERKKKNGLTGGCLPLETGNFSLSSLQKLATRSQLGEEFLFIDFVFFFEKNKHLWYIYRRKLIAKDKLLNWGDGGKKKVTNKSKSNSGGNCDNSPTKLAPSSPVSPGLKRQRWIKKKIIINHVL